MITLGDPPREIRPSYPKTVRYIPDLELDSSTCKNNFLQVRLLYKINFKKQYYKFMILYLLLRAIKIKNNK